MKRIKIISLILISVLAFLGLLRLNITSIPGNIDVGLLDIQYEAPRPATTTNREKKEIILPLPLKKEEREPQSFLTSEGIIEITNNYREENRLPPLTVSRDLNQSAEIKIDDMIDNQYFAHISPSGLGVGEVVESVGYDFIVVGENLAVGDFQDDQSLVEGWMESPGHRENILNQRYQEIGVSVKKGTYQGRKTWFAVQHFALPLSVCERPNQALENQIGENKEEIEGLRHEINTLRQEIDSYQLKYGRGYNQDIREYNLLVDQYNSLLQETEGLIDIYNNQVQDFNDCIRGE